MNVKIEAQLRSKGKKSDMKNLRKQGFIPAVIYAEGNLGKNISLEKIPFMKVYRTTIGETAFFDISVEGKTYTTIIKARQIHPVNRDYTHLDFLEIQKGKAITLFVPIIYTGEAKGLLTGGVMDVLVRKLEVSCLPKDIPESIGVDVTELEIGDSIHLREIELQKMETKTPESTTLVAVRAPRKIEEPVEKAEEGEVPEEGDEEGEGSQEVTEKTTE